MESENGGPIVARRRVFLPRCGSLDVTDVDPYELPPARPCRRAAHVQLTGLDQAPGHQPVFVRLRRPKRALRLFRAGLALRLLREQDASQRYNQERPS